VDDTDFDTALIASALTLAGIEGWRSVTVASAARAAGLPLSQARVRFPTKAAILLGFGRMADELTLEDAPDEGPVRDRLFDLLMRRFDALQAQRSGILAVLRALPFDPCSAVLLACATRRSMLCMLQAAGCSATGLSGELHVKGLMAVWLWAIRAWEKDESEDLTVTMAALDVALSRAEQAAGWFASRPTAKVELEAPNGEPATEK
jgi:ubiquinone biosynthesis protein COQ9